MIIEKVGLEAYYADFGEATSGARVVSQPVV